MKIYSNKLHEFLRLRELRAHKRTGTFKAYMRMPYRRFA